MIPKEFTLITHLYNKYEDFIACYPPEHFYAMEDDIVNPDTNNLWKDDLERTFEDDYNYYTKKRVYFVGCNFDIYKEHYINRLASYLKDKEDALEIDFIIRDFNSINFNYLFGLASDRIKEQIEVSLRRQREYLEEKAKSLGCLFSKTKDKYNTDFYTYKRLAIKETDLIDLSDTSLSEKIIYLNKLGVLDYLKGKPENGFSINQLSNLLSAILGEKSSTIQSYLNPIDNPSVSQKNNPMINTKNVDKVTYKLIELGFIKSN